MVVWRRTLRCALIFATGFAAGPPAKVSSAWMASRGGRRSGGAQLRREMVDGASRVPPSREVWLVPHVAQSFLEEDNDDDRGNPNEVGTEGSNGEPAEESKLASVLMFPSPLGICRKRLGQSSIIATGSACLKLGGLMKHASVLDDQEGNCLLDWCVDGMYSLFPPGRCQHNVAAAKLQMTKADCADAQGGLPRDWKGNTGDADIVNCTMEFCEDLGAFAVKPAGSCSQPLLMRHTQAEDCRSMFGNVDPNLTGNTWTDNCEMDICMTDIQLRLEVDTRSVPRAATTQGARVAFHVLGAWQPPISFCTSAEPNETIALDTKLISWPDKLTIRANGLDGWGFREIRIVYKGASLPVLRDFQVMGIDNDQPANTSSYWVGLGVWTPASIEYDVPMVSHLWRSFGNDLSCRLGRNDETENAGGASKEVFATSPSACRGICEERGDCFGVEFELSLKRCELWFKPVGHAMEASGYQCFVYWVDPKMMTPERAQQTPFFQMLKAEGGRCLDHDPEAEDPAEDVFVHECTNSLTQQWHLEGRHIFSRSEPIKCLAFNGVGKHVSVVDCGKQGTSSMATVANVWDQTTLGTPPPDWTMLVQPVGSNWTFDGRRVSANDGVCLTADLSRWDVVTEPCDNARVEQDWSFMSFPSWKQKILGLMD